VVGTVQRIIHEARKKEFEIDALDHSRCFRKYLPSRANREIRKLDEEVRLLILDVIKDHSSHTSSNDLLYAIMNGAHDQGSHDSVAEDREFVIASCKTIYFAGHETTAVTIIWCLMLLATHPEWQERARAEAQEVCQGRATLDPDVLRRLKIVSNIVATPSSFIPSALSFILELHVCTNYN
jgi:cytochrome P450